MVVETQGNMVYVRAGKGPDGVKREWAEHLTNVVRDKGELESSGEDQE